MLSELLYADGLDLMSETIERNKNKIRKCKEASESKYLKVNLGKNQSNGQKQHYKRWPDQCVK